VDNEIWKCPGHGSIVEDEKGNDYLMYHAYHAQDFVYVGRQALLDKIEWNSDGWPSINHGTGPGTNRFGGNGPGAKKSRWVFEDRFRSAKLNTAWQWPQNIEPRWKIKEGALLLQPAPDRGTNLLGAVLAIKTVSGHYTAETVIDRKSVHAGSLAGFSAFGDADNALGLVLNASDLQLWRRQRARHEILSTQKIEDGPELHIRITASEGHKFRFLISADGRAWKDVGGNVDLEGEYLPPWDRGVRVALTVGGSQEAEGRFKSFSMEAELPKGP
jgi:beta-xylosidase